MEVYLYIYTHINEHIFNTFDKIFIQGDFQFLEKHSFVKRLILKENSRLTLRVTPTHPLLTFMS